MPLPQLLKKKAEKLLEEYCRSRVPSWLEEELRLNFTIDDESATVYQERRRCQGACEWLRVPLAQFRYSEILNQWTLHHYDENQQWRFYLNISPNLDIGKLIKAVDDDPLGYFWG
ncbi:MAG TPA: DUF3024 domain-containing protein [Geopsychrobacteraceae bacterium]|nr:DUF3024 domain-containing protein [Geopsychrobacteraceae bacterium]